MAPVSASLFATCSLLAALALGAPAPSPAPSPARELQGLGVPIMNADAKNIIPNKYVVVYNDTFDDDAIATHEAYWVDTIAKRNIGKRSPIDNRMLSMTVHTFTIGSMRAMCLEADDASAIEINSADEVSYIEADAYVHLNALVTQQNATTGLARMSSAQAGGSTYTFDDTAGQGITAFIVDTGIMEEHEEFEGRATFAFNSADNINTDANGHGSHVAGTIGGKTFGVAKKATLIGVKVLDAQGAGTNSGVIAGMNFGKHMRSWDLPSLPPFPPPPRWRGWLTAPNSRPDGQGKRALGQVGHEHVPGWRALQRRQPGHQRPPCGRRRPCGGRRQ